MTKTNAITILARAKKIVTTSGSEGWLVGAAGGVDWVAYTKADIKTLRQGLKRRMAK